MEPCHQWEHNSWLCRWSGWLTGQRSPDSCIIHFRDYYLSILSIYIICDHSIHSLLSKSASSNAVLNTTITIFYRRIDLKPFYHHHSYQLEFTCQRYCRAFSVHIYRLPPSRLYSVSCVRWVSLITTVLTTISRLTLRASPATTPHYRGAAAPPSP